MSRSGMTSVERWLCRQRTCPYIVDASGRWAKWCGKKSKPGHPQGYCREHAKGDAR